MKMKTVGIKNEIHAELIKLCGRIQALKGERVPISSVIVYLLKFQRENKKRFETFISRKRQFNEEYQNKIKNMRSEGLPTTKDITHAI